MVISESRYNRCEYDGVIIRKYRVLLLLITSLLQVNKLNARKNRGLNHKCKNAPSLLSCEMLNSTISVETSIPHGEVQNCEIAAWSYVAKLPIFGTDFPPGKVFKRDIVGPPTAGNYHVVYECNVNKST